MDASQRAYSNTAKLRNDIVAFSDLAGSTSNQTTICVMIVIFSLSPLPQCAFRIRNKADLPDKLDNDNTHKGSLSIFAHLANFKKYKHH